MKLYESAQTVLVYLIPLQAKIPSPLTKEQELEQTAKLAVRRKAQRQAKQERQRVKKQEDRIKVEQEKVLQAEEKEKKIFLALSDREKVCKVFKHLS